MFKNQLLTRTDSSVEHVYRKLFRSKTESLRQFLLDGPTHQPSFFRDYDPTSIHLKIRKLSQKIGLAILSWYFPEEIRFIVQLSLRETWGAESREVKEILLSSKDFALTWLICESKWTESDFFGNVLDKRLSKLWKLSNFKRLSRKRVKKYTGWCRGHQESNHRSSEFFDPELYATSSTTEEYQREMLFQEQLLLLQRKIEMDFLNLLLSEEISGSG